MCSAFTHTFIRVPNKNNNRMSFPSVPPLCVCVTCCEMDPSGQPTSAAQRRAALWHERLRVAMALAEFSHHSSRGQRMARVGRWVREEVHGRAPGAPPLSPPLPCRSPARSTSFSTTTACRSSGARDLTVSLASGRRSESRVALWSRSSIPCLLFLCSIFCGADGGPVGESAEYPPLCISQSSRTSADFLKPSTTKSSSSSTARGGRVAGVSTPRRLATK